MLHPSHAGPPTGTANGHYDALDRPREADLVEGRANFLLDQVRIGQELRIPRIEIENDVMVKRHFVDASEKRARRSRQPEKFGVGAEDVNALAVIVVLGRHTRAA